MYKVRLEGMSFLHSESAQGFYHSALMAIPAASDRPDSACCALIIPITEAESSEHRP